MQRRATAFVLCCSLVYFGFLTLTPGSLVSRIPSATVTSASNRLETRATVVNRGIYTGGPCKYDFLLIPGGTLLIAGHA